ncbi:Uncharacterised protein [uncultured Eubacterium sp.]|nr:Uncharacterised protein [uncultured Eubacterium sp.]
MKRKLLTALISASLILGVTSIPSFAEAEQGYIDDVNQLKSVLQQDVRMEDLKDIVAPEVAAEFMGEKLNQAVELIGGQKFTADMQEQTDGSLYGEQSFDLGDGCEFVIELSDKSEEYLPATSRAVVSDPKWLGYGNRSFTAKASVKCAIGTANMSLTNRYELSANGIDERPGIATCSCSSMGSSITNGTPQITDSVARTPGASDVNMHCVYSLTAYSVKGSIIKSKYKLNTTIGFVDINKSTKKVKVKQSWSLAKVS